jgi:hypothetical protein
VETLAKLRRHARLEHGRSPLDRRIGGERCRGSPPRTQSVARRSHLREAAVDEQFDAADVALLEIIFARCCPVSDDASRSARPGVSIEPGLTAFTRIRRSFKSVVHVRAKERTAALVAL